MTRARGRRKCGAPRPGLTRAVLCYARNADCARMEGHEGEHRTRNGRVWSDGDKTSRWPYCDAGPYKEL